MIYDCFSFFNELDLLEIRLNILDPYVDKFVLMESTQTFSGKEKPLYFSENKERFAKWLDKIVVVIPPKHKVYDSFEMARYQKQFLTEGLKDAEDDDIVYYGDVDEIWKPQEIKDYKVYSLEQLNYCYYLNNRSSEEWVGTIVGKWLAVKALPFREWRAAHHWVIKDAGWHFTNMGGVDQIRQKLEAYDHQEMNTQHNQSLVAERIKNKQDYVGRKYDWLGKPFEFWQDEQELPLYLKDNKHKYIHLYE